MNKYIGIDVHAASSTVAVIGESGRRLGTFVVETTGEAVLGCIRMIAGKRHICFEEGVQSAWLYELLEPHAERVVVAAVGQSPRGQKSDDRDAFSLAERMRVGTIDRAVFKQVGAYKTLRELGRAHMMVVQDVVRVQNRIKSLYRSRGVAVTGKQVYGVEGRHEWLERLGPGTRQAAETLYAQYDAILEIRKRAEKELTQEARRHSISKVLETCPGLGPIRVAQLVPIVVTPHRFRTKRQFWSYCGLGIVMRSSSDWVRDKTGGWQRAKVQQTRGLNLAHNHQLKAIFKGAATTVVMQLHEDPLYADYSRLLEGGTKPNLAKVSIARKIAAITLAMWKTEKEYNATQHRKQVSE
jgi:transposase